jgi:hypothetical protein
MLTVEQLKELLDYDPLTGVFTLRVARRRGTKVGDRAGCLDTSNGYERITVCGEDYKSHRLAWMFVYGVIPVGCQVDHINNKRSDNRIANLRLATQAQNNSNTSVKRTNKLGVKGVEVCGDKFRAHIVFERHKHHLGVFDTVEEAHAAYLAKARELYGEFAKV